MRRLLLLFICLHISLFAGTTGKLTGKITDQSTGEVIPFANVLLLETTMGGASDINGNYTILNIPPGVYSLKFSNVGYQSVVIENVRVFVDQTTEINMELNPSAIELDQIVVSAETELVKKDVTSSISVVTRDEIETLPVADFTELLTMQAGVVGSGNNLHLRGGRSNEIAFMVDGMYVQDPLLGGLATQISNDAIQEMSLLSGTFNAEYGNAMSGVVNIVTRDGSDKFNGKLEVRTSEFGISKYSDLHETRVNGALSGPIIPGVIRFFLSGEQDNRGSYLPFGYRINRSAFGKLTFHTTGMKVTASVRGSDGERRPYSHSFKYIPEQYVKIKTDSYQSTLAFTHTVANNLFYDVRLSYFNQGYYNGVGKDTSQYLSTADRVYLADKGTGFEFYEQADPLSLTDSRTVTLDGKFDLVWQWGDVNEIKTGIQYKQHKLKLFNVYDPKRTFPYINDYETEPFEAAAYFQDKIELPYLIINLGLRYDYVNANVTFRNDPLDPNSLIEVKSRSQLSPRIGIAHPISDRTKLHFAYGHFFQNPDYQYLFENNQYDLNVREPLFGSPDLDAVRTIAYEVGVSHQFTDRIAMHLTAYYKDVTGLIGTRYFFPFEDGRYTGYTLYINEDYANMRGFEVNVDFRTDKYFSGGLTYTYSIAKGSASSETEQYPGTQESTLLYYLDFDKRHVLNASTTISVPENEGPKIFDMYPLENTDISVILRASSGYPYTPGGRDVGFVVRNSLRMPGMYTVDLEIGKEIVLFKNIRMRIFAEILNATDYRNILYVYSDTGEPDVTFEGEQSEEYMNNPANYGAPRSIRLGIGLEF